MKQKRRPKQPKRLKRQRKRPKQPKKLGRQRKRPEQQQQLEQRKKRPEQQQQLEQRKKRPKPKQRKKPLEQQRQKLHRHEQQLLNPLIFLQNFSKKQPLRKQHQVSILINKSAIKKIYLKFPKQTTQVSFRRCSWNSLYHLRK